MGEFEVKNDELAGEKERGREKSNRNEVELKDFEARCGEF